jgi:hypothetical protein
MSCCPHWMYSPSNKEYPPIYQFFSEMNNGTPYGLLHTIGNLGVQNACMHMLKHLQYYVYI